MTPPSSTAAVSVHELDWADPSLWPDLDAIVTEDSAPVDNPFSEKEMRLLTEPLYVSWPGPGNNRPFRVLANVGLYGMPTTPLVPDVMLGLDVRTPQELMVKGHRAWFLWIVGKWPDAVIEIVSNTQGGEDSDKMTEYANIGVPYYVIHDPANLLKRGVLRHSRCAGPLRADRRTLAGQRGPRVGAVAREIRGCGSGMAALVRSRRQRDSDGRRTRGGGGRGAYGG